jgi:hypothetical protein
VNGTLEFQKKHEWFEICKQIYKHYFIHTYYKHCEVHKCNLFIGLSIIVRFHAEHHQEHVHIGILSKQGI